MAIPENAQGTMPEGKEELIAFFTEFLGDTPRECDVYMGDLSLKSCLVMVHEDGTIERRAY